MPRLREIILFTNRLLQVYPILFTPNNDRSSTATCRQKSTLSRVSSFVWARWRSETGISLIERSVEVFFLGLSSPLCLESPITSMPRVQAADPDGPRLTLRLRCVSICVERMKTRRHLTITRLNDREETSGQNNSASS